MRTPSDTVAALQWWRDALAGKKPAITNEPHCGFFKRRLVKGGAWVPAKIWIEQLIDQDGELTAPETMRCEVNGRARDAEDQWLWLCTHPIPQSEYLYLVSLSSWAQQRAPQDPAASPSSSVDFNDSPIPF